MRGRAGIMSARGGADGWIGSSRRGGDGKPPCAGRRAADRRGGRRRPHPREELPELRRLPEWPLLRPMRPEGARPPFGPRFLPGFYPGPLQFRREDLAYAADAGLVSGVDDEALYCRRAGSVRLARGALP